MAAGETNIGGIVGFLRLEAGQFHREIQQALLELEALEDKDVRVAVKADTAGAAGLERLPQTAKAASRALDDLGAAERRVEDATKRVNLATLKLSELRESGKAKASQLMAAEQALAKARRDEQDAIFSTYDANRHLEKSNDDLVDSNDDVADSHKRVKREADNARGSSQLLIATIVGLAPAVVPLAGAAVALAAGFGGMAVAGVAAFMGIKAEVEKGTEVGRAYKAGVADLKGELTELGTTAAGGLLAPFQQAVADVTSNIDALNEATGNLTAITGTAAGHLEHGLMQAFLQLQPMIQDAAFYIGELMAKFDALMSGPGVVAFGDYVRSIFPQVMSAIESLVGAASNLIAALAPIGLGVVDAIKVFSDVLSAIPTSVLTVIAQLAISVYTGFTLWKLLAVPMAMLKVALGDVENWSRRAAIGMRLLSVSAGVIAVAIGALSFIFTAMAENTRDNQQAIDDYADALRRSNGIIDESIQQATAKKLADEGVFEAGRKLGIGQKDILDAALGNEDAMRRVAAAAEAAKTKFSALSDGSEETVGAANELNENINKVTGAIDKNNGQLDAGIVKYNDLKAATEGASGSTSGAAGAVQNLADTYGVSSSVFENAIAQQQGLADKAAAATLQMQLENDAAGLLKQSLDELNGEHQSSAQATNAFERAQMTVSNPLQQARENEARAKAALEAANASDGKGPSQGAKNGLASAQLNQRQAAEHLATVQSSGKATASQLESARQRLERANLRLAQAEGKVAGATGPANEKAKEAAEKAYAEAKAKTAATKAIQGNTDEAITNRSNLLSVIKSAEAAAEAYGNEKDSAEAGRQELIKRRDEIIKNAVAQGYNKDEVTKFVNELLKIPASVPPTKAELDTAAALKKKKELQDAINAITGKTVTLTLQEVYQTAGGGSKGHAAAQKVHNEQVLDRHGHSSALRDGGPIPGYATGTLVGPGTGTSDSILAQVAETGRILRVSAGEFVSTDASRKRNLKALEAGNRGATLTVANGIPKGGGTLRVSAGRAGTQGGAGGRQEAARDVAGTRLHPEDIDALARRLGREIRKLPTPELGLARLDRAMGDL